MKRKGSWFPFVMLALLVATTAAAVTFPPLTITGTTLDATVTYDQTRGVYRYAYTLIAPASNKAPIDGWHIDVTGRVARPQDDPSLQGNAVRRNHGPATTIPVGLTVPDPSVWRAGTTPRGWVFFYPLKDAFDVLPGTSAIGFVIESKLPPNIRNVTISPSDSAWDAVEAQMTGEIEDPPSSKDFEITTTTIAPFDAQDSDYFNGGGQSPANVNPFLRYLSPKESRTKLPAGTTSYLLIVNYGRTTIPASFAATFNGVDVTSRFHPIPGTTEVVKFTLVPGSNKVHLSIDGVTSSGRTARDADTLTLLVP